ncbi:hypothetical protein JCM10207_007819 [Rhodosporidiobolus poonsookiae]
MSFSSLPVELVREIASHLDPSPLCSVHEAPSLTRVRRDAGRALALVSRNAQLAGSELVWRRLVVGFHRNPDLALRVLEEKWMAEYVRQLHVYCGPRATKTILCADSPYADLVPLCTALEQLCLAGSPSVIERLLSRAKDAPHLANLRVVELASSTGVSPSFPTFLLDVLPTFRSVEDLTLNLRVQSDAVPPVPSPTAAPALHPSTVFLLIEDDLHPPAYAFCTSFLTSLTSLVSARALTTFTFYASYAPPSLLAFLAPAAHLTTLTLSLSVGALATRLPDLVALLPALTKLESLVLEVQPAHEAPLILPPAHPLRAELLQALGAAGTRALRTVGLDVDLLDRPARLADAEGGGDVGGMLARQLELGKGRGLRYFQCVEWEEAIGVRRMVVLERGEEEGRERWEVTQGE